MDAFPGCSLVNIKEKPRRVSAARLIGPKRLLLARKMSLPALKRLRGIGLSVASGIGSVDKRK